MKGELSWDTLIQDYHNKLGLKNIGRSYKAFSPFNKERYASFVITPEKNIWKDFSSGIVGKGPNSLIKELEVFESWDEVH